MVNKHNKLQIEKKKKNKIKLKDLTCNLRPVQTKNPSAPPSILSLGTPNKVKFQTKIPCHPPENTRLVSLRGVLSLVVVFPEPKCLSFAAAASFAHCV